MKSRAGVKIFFFVGVVHRIESIKELGYGTSLGHIFSLWLDIFNHHEHSNGTEIKRY